ncbi:MAG TPA: 5-(carboxyamino)imidazole ribonucleotide synthase [Candidatus Saccharimonadales bacterium]|nr:5-(carboxyamino)imidazole ribonucleotide synthase [Candidatus Saccharimonadales bacterium]
MPAKVIGIVGGGQLGRMLTEAATPMGFKVAVVDPGENCPAKQVGAEQIVAELHDEKALHELASKVDVITIEIEHVDAKLLAEINELGKPVHPAPATIAMIQDKFAQKQFLHKAGIAVADFVEVTNEASAKKALQDFGGKMLLKTRFGAYDGRGNMVISSEEDLAKGLEFFKNQPLYAEKFVPFVKELAVMVARSTTGETAVYPVVETIQERNICVEVLAPAPIDNSARETAKKLALQVVENMEGAGVYGIEMFLTDDEQVIVNEIAPRVHNSGHYTIEGCETSQFEQHIRAITGLPLGPTSLVAPAAVMVNILGERDGETLNEGLDTAKDHGATVHMYGKAPTKIDRKMGHLTVTGEDLETVKVKAEAARKAITV